MDTQLEQDVRGWIQQVNVPGVSLAVIRAGVIADTVVFGVADAETGHPITPATVFQAASITKPVFAYLVHDFLRTNRLDLDKPLHNYLPYPDLRDDPRAASITARQVLAHMTGLPNWRMDQPLKTGFAPGERWSYSGEGYVYLQRVIEELTGESLQKLLNQNVFKPLKMTSSSVIWRAGYQNHFATGHDEAGKAQPVPPRRKANAAYTLYSTPTDIARFVLAMFADNAITRAMLTLNTPVNAHAPWAEDWHRADYQTVPDVGWGSGWGLQRQNNGWSFWHWGDNGTYQCFVTGNPVMANAIIVMTNGANGRQVYTPLIERLIPERQPALDWLTRIYGA